MTTFDTKHLRALAEASLSRGTWVEEDHSDAIIIQGSEGCAHDGRAIAVAEHVYLAEDRAYIAAIDPPMLIALLDELEGYRRWKAEAIDVLLEWEKTWVAAGRPGRPGTSKAVGVRDEIERLRGDTEWEYAVRNLSTGEVFEPVNGKWWRTTDNEEPVRRRKAGPWELVEEETND